MRNIAFPKLGLDFNIDSVALRLPFNINITWYGIIIVTGMILAVLITTNEMKKRGYNPEMIIDFVIIAIPLAIVGARLYYVIFSWDSYKDNLWEIVATWHGGLAIYGGVIAGAIYAVIFTRIKKIPFLLFADIAVMGCILAQAIGRWGNFTNGEAFGGETDLLWGMSINGGACVHPTFFYESLWNFIGFIIMYFVIRKIKKNDGVCFAFYLMWYGSGRFFIEGLRSDSLYIGSLRVSQIVAALCVLGGLGLLFYIKKHKNLISGV